MCHKDRCAGRAAREAARASRAARTGVCEARCGATVSGRKRAVSSSIFAANAVYRGFTRLKRPRETPNAHAKNRGARSAF